MKEEARKLLEKGRRALHAGETLLREGDYEFAAGRAYYAMLHAAQALLRELAGVMGLALEERQPELDRELLITLVGQIARKVEEEKLLASPLKGDSEDDISIFARLRDEDTRRVIASFAPEDMVARMLRLRERLRRGKQYALADRIREALAELGVVLEDTPQGTVPRYRKQGSPGNP